MNKTVIVVIDAFRHDYISEENTPYMHSLIGKSKYFQKLMPSYGFCERTEILVGLTSEESNFFTAIEYNPVDAPYKSIKSILIILSVVISWMPKLGKKIIRRLLWEFGSRIHKGFAPVNIPLEVLGEFSLSEDGLKSQIEAHPNSLYNLAQSCGLKLNDDSFTNLDKKHSGTDNSRINQVISNIDDDSDLYLLYLSECDHYGHYYGPETPEFSSRIFEVDKNIKRLHQELLDKINEIDFILIGDHGMTQIHTKIDLINELKNHLSSYRHGTDYLIFADSTVFRVWIKNQKVKEEITDLLFEFFKQEHLIENGKFTQPKDIGFRDDRKYGDYVWLANPGVVVSPDYFNPKYKTLNGMHGYNPNLDLSCLGMSIMNGPSFEPTHINDAELTQVYTEIKNLMT